MLNHLRVLDSLNHAYYTQLPSSEPRAPKVTMPPSPEGLETADWVSQVLEYQMDEEVGLELLTECVLMDLHYTSAPADLTGEVLCWLEGFQYGTIWQLD